MNLKVSFPINERLPDTHDLFKHVVQNIFCAMVFFIIHTSGSVS